MKPLQRIVKRLFDLLLSLSGLIVCSPIILIGWMAASWSTKNNGFFVQQRVGMHGKCFPMIKLRTMKKIDGLTTTVTAQNDARITRVGSFLRSAKIDELPQLLNVAVGHMSLVGPRPDVPGFADTLEGDDRIVLSVRPGITGPASIAFRKEEELLASVEHPDSYNKTVIWPEKIRLNRLYILNYSFWLDIKYIWQTISGKGG